MPYGPSGQWRPDDPGACARLVCDIATGERAEVYAPPEDYQEGRVSLAEQGGKARAEKLDPERRSEIAAKGGKARWPQSSEAIVASSGPRKRKRKS